MLIDRRGFLGALALAPAALAGCAGGSAAAGAGAPPHAAAAGAPDAPADTRVAALAAVRGFALAPGAEPAFVFRAAAARPGEP
jgi:hypothetical protein